MSGDVGLGGAVEARRQGYAEARQEAQRHAVPSIKPQHVIGEDLVAAGREAGHQG